MKIITAANAKYAVQLTALLRSSQRFYYDVYVYDLGGLDIGKPFQIDDESFQQFGFYRQLDGGWKSRSLFKPSVVKDAMAVFPNEQLVWLDSDCEIVKPLGSFHSDFDIAVADRSDKERKENEILQTCGMEGVNVFRGNHNAGVIVFNPTDDAKTFVSKWELLTNKIQNDQIALNMLVKKTKVKVEKLPHIFNTDVLDSATIVHHKKGKAKDTK